MNAVRVENPRWGGKESGSNIFFLSLSYTTLKGDVLYILNAMSMHHFLN